MRIPEEVTDKKEYIKYITKKKHYLLNKGQRHIASDGTEINLAAFTHHVRRYVSHLPLKEAKQILELKAQWQQINNEVTGHMKKAFNGNKNNVKGKLPREKNLLRNHHEQVLELFKKFHTPADIVKICNEEWGLPIGVASAKAYYELHKKEIEEGREKYKAGYVNVRLGIKRTRLEEYAYLYEIQKKKFKDKPSNENLRLLKDLLADVRREAEGDRLTIDGKLDVNYEVNIQQHLRDEVFRTLNLKEIVLGRVAARMGVNPIKLIHSLNNSFYNKFSNVLGNYSEEGEGEIVYPSQMSYDFERIGKAQSFLDKHAEDAIIENEAQESDKDLEQAKSVRDILLESLKKKTDSFKK